MDYVAAPLLFRIQKALRYIRLYGIRRTLVKVRGQYHMRRRYSQLPPNHIKGQPEANVGIIGCGNYAYSVIAYYLTRKYGPVIRGCMDADINRAVSLFKDYRAHYFTSDAEELIRDPDIRLIFIASNHASHAEYAIRALEAGKDVHIEKPHVVSEDQLSRLCETLRRSSGRIVSIGFNRPHSAIGTRIQTLLRSQSGPLLQSWFIVGHELPPGHWYHNEGEGGRVLGNLCHWTDLTYQMMPPDNRFPVTITPMRSERSDCDIGVGYTFSDGSIAVITFTEAAGHAFEGVRERYAAQKGAALIQMDDFQRCTVSTGDRTLRYQPRHRDHGHQRSVLANYAASTSNSDALICSEAYVREAAELFLKTRKALDLGEPVLLNRPSPP